MQGVSLPRSLWSLDVHTSLMTRPGSLVIAIFGRSVLVPRLNAPNSEGRTYTSSMLQAHRLDRSSKIFRTKICRHKFPLPTPFLIPGGSLTALAYACLPLASPSRDPEPVFFPPTTRASSTFPFASPNPGVTQPPQLHLNPCHANFPMFAPHHCVGQVRRPSRAPSDKVGLIHDNGCRKMCAQGSSEGLAEGSRWGGGLCGRMNVDFASRRRHFRHLISRFAGRGDA